MPLAPCPPSPPTLADPPSAGARRPASPLHAAAAVAAPERPTHPSEASSPATAHGAAGAHAAAFADAALALAELARLWGVVPPAFRSPPADPSRTRSLRRSQAGSVVAVRVQGRAWEAVATDLVDGLFAVHPGCDTPARRHQAVQRVARVRGTGAVQRPAA